MPEGDLNKLKKMTVGIRGLLSQPELRQLSNQTGILGQRFLDEHNTQANYLGGLYQEKGYSTANLPAFFFGEVSFVQRTKNIRINAPKFNRSNQLIKSADVFWRTNEEGKRTAYIRGGYAKWLQYTRPGKDLNKVDHTFTGAMLRNLTHDIIFKSNGSEIRWYVRHPHDDKAYYTHRLRHWMGFFDREFEQIKKQAIETFSVEVFKRITE